MSVVGGGSAGPGPGQRAERQTEHSVVRVKAEDYELVSKDYTSVKIICLGDSAVGKSK